jgi:hypothetical protein
LWARFAIIAHCGKKTYTYKFYEWAAIRALLNVCEKLTTLFVKNSP